MLKNLKNNKKKGFTLVELIVVLVILAILAALLIPALTGYIDKAKEKQIVAETRQVVMAAQTLYDEQYGKVDVSKTPSLDTTLGTGDKSTVDDNGKITLSKSEVATLAEVTADNIKEITSDGTIITKVKYEASERICTYTRNSKTDKGTYEVSK